ncbi:HEAT repeat domain-containing protein [Enterococcus avium]|uniref:HEAT repeat domain-containing protein n=1 Tax=Enterococcus avium TaxID=33945 RepID=UPI00339542FD
MIDSKPKNYEELKKKAQDLTSWRNRSAAIKELSKYNHKSVKDILWRMMISDKVYSVQESAFRALQAMGEKVKLPKKKKGNIISDMNKKLSKVKNSLPEEHSFEQFKIELKKVDLRLYDVIEGDKGKKTDEFLENIWKSLPKKK